MALGDFTFPTRNALFTETFELVKSYMPDLDTAPLSHLWITAKSQAKAVFQVMRTVDRGIRAVFPTTSYGVFLEDLAFSYGAPDKQGGFGRILATGSGPVIDGLNVTSDAATTLSNLKELIDTGGLRYRIVNGPYVFPSATTIAVDVEAIDVGAATNLETGAVLTFLDPDANIQEEATLVKDLDGGLEREEDPALRARVIDRTQNPGLGGNDIQWKRAIESVAFAIRGFVWPQRIQGAPGTVDYGAIQTEETADARILTTEIRDAITAAVEDPETGMPVRQLKQSRLVTLAPELVVATVLFTLDPDAPASKATDWDAESVRALVAAYTPATPSILANTDLDGVLPDITGGKGVSDGQVYRIGIGGEEVVIQTFDSGADPRLLTLANAFTEVTPPLGELIQSGGGIYTKVHADLIDYFDEVGPEKGDFASPEISPWDDTIRILFVQKAALDADDRILDVVVEDVAGGTVDKAPTPLVGEDPVPILSVQRTSLFVLEDKS